MKEGAFYGLHVEVYYESLRLSETVILNACFLGTCGRRLLH